MRLIDADALIKQLQIDPLKCPGCPEPEWLEEFCQLIEAAPAVDAVSREEYAHDKAIWMRRVIE